MFDEPFFKVVLIALALALVLVLIFGFTGCGPNYSEGSRSGVVYKLSYKGVIWKSYEGSMNLGGMSQDATSKSGGLVANVWAFSVADPAVVKEVEAAQKSGERVVLHYKEWLMGPAQYSTGYIVWKVEREKQPEVVK